MSVGGDATRDARPSTARPKEWTAVVWFGSLSVVALYTCAGPARAAFSARTFGCGGWGGDGRRSGINHSYMGKMGSAKLGGRMFLFLLHDTMLSCLLHPDRSGTRSVSARPLDRPRNTSGELLRRAPLGTASTLPDANRQGSALASLACEACEQA